MPTEPEPHFLSYRDAGVDTRRADRLIDHIKLLQQQAPQQHAAGTIGGFAALCPLPAGLKQPLLVSCTDGVGTKLCLAQSPADYRSLGQDLVAMCVNDLIVCGATPLQFQDYYACGRIDSARSEALLEGINHACAEAGCTLAGGETAEMPGVYPEDGFDLAGFCLGVVEKSALIDGQRIQPGDQIMALPSDGLHANGFSLVRRVLESTGLDASLQQQLMQPTRLYPKVFSALQKTLEIKGVAHITGGGLAANLARILPSGTRAELSLKRWQRAPIFHWLRAQGPISNREMLATFNCGLGLVLVIAPEQLELARTALEELGEPFLHVGEIYAAQTEQPPVTILDLDAF